MAWSVALKIPALDAATPYCGYVSGWFFDSPDFFEVTSRETVSWPAAADYSVEASNQPVLDVAEACTISFVALFPASTGGMESMSAYKFLVPPVEFTEAGTYTITFMNLALEDPA